MAPLEVWGGLECTVNRIQDDYHDQTRLSGHHDRPEDLALFADLGCAAIRYPVLWERVAPDEHTPPDWTWTDDRLGRLRDLGIRPIAGLVHHGSGPRHTHLLDDAFAQKLGRYAGGVAARYPWIDAWTPINEPLTTARFSALYGHWYPHHRDERDFWSAMLNQIDGTRAAMRAIRQVNPAARLIQTDDLGRTYATDRLGAQAAFDNARRWAGWDLLFGRIVPGHALWERLAEFGFAERLRAIADDPCPPDVIGVNHYLTSDRFLDHRLARYPAHTHGGNAEVPYADVEAVRVLDPAPAGLAGALREAWARYATPIAVTEVHNGSTREEQLRWAAEAWDTAVALRGESVDVRAVTAWALLGSHGWNTLLTMPGLYEPGIFDATTDRPRPTALAALWRGLPMGAVRHPVAAQAGWWRRPGRLLYPPAVRTADTTGDGSKVLLICGATGTLGQAFARSCAARGIAYRIVGRGEMDLEAPEGIGVALDHIRPWGVVNATGWVRVDEAEADEAACHRINATGAIALAQACAARGIGCLGFSSDLVFNGAASRAYRESDPVAPLGAYGRSKAAMEAGCAQLPESLVVRTAAFFSPDDPYNFAVATLDALEREGRFAAAGDQVVTPTFVPGLVDAALDLLIDGAQGIWHISGDEPVSWAAFAARIAVAAGYAAEDIRAVPGAALGWIAERPAYAALASERGAVATSLQRGIEAVVRGRERRLADAA